MYDTSVLVVKSFVGIHYKMMLHRAYDVSRKLGAEACYPLRMVSVALRPVRNGSHKALAPCPAQRRSGRASTRTVPGYRAAARPDMWRPISRLRSVTLASMTFMMPMPATRSETAAALASSRAMVRAPSSPPRRASQAHSGRRDARRHRPIVGEAQSDRVSREIGQGRRPARVTVTSRRIAALERRELAAVRACRQ